MDDGAPRLKKNQSDELAPVEYLEVFLSVSRSIHDATCNFIIENYSNGLVLEEEEDSEVVGIRFYLPVSDYPEIAFKTELADYIKSMAVDSNSSDKIFTPNDVTVKRIKNAKWEEKYRESIKPIFIENVVIRPPWIEVETQNKLDIIIEPKMAFGTGSHETTKLCILEILKHFKPGQTFFDLGCGSGILSILAAKLGAGKIKGVDNNLISVENARENRIINKVEDKFDIEFGSVELALTDPPYDFFVANIIKSTIIGLFDKIYISTGQNGIIVLSGLLEEDQVPIEKMLRAAYPGDKYNINNDGQWLSITVFKS